MTKNGNAGNETNNKFAFCKMGCPGRRNTFVLLALIPVHAFAYKVVFNQRKSIGGGTGEGGSVTSDATII